MPSIADLPTPALVLDLDVLDRNLEAMAARAESFAVALRPHVKTHKCVEIGERQRAMGAHGITVSTLAEAYAFAEHEFDDITWAFPVVLGRLDEARELAERTRLRVAVDSKEAVQALEHTGTPFHVWLKVDAGYHRAGVNPNASYAVDVARALHDSSSLRFDGLLTHGGHAYNGPTRDEVWAAAVEERDMIVAFADRLQSLNIDVQSVSVGSTPGMAAIDHLDGVDEVRPGNYVFNDYIQVQLGTCAPADCAVTVLASVVSSQPGARHCVTDAGALALSKDAGHSDGTAPTMGQVYADYGLGTLRSGTHLTSLSQEHGVLNQPLALGTRVRILPNHSCLTVACFDHYDVVIGDEVVDRWEVRRRR
jgi:D-serine deaminase-like pyridoxal phosphate-dependent protein